MDLQDQHPLRETAQIQDVFPVFKIFCKTRSKKVRFQQGLKHSLLKKLGLKMPKTDREIEEEPFLIFGYCTNAYFDVLLSLFHMFGAIFVFSLPILYIYRMGIEGVPTQFHLIQLTLGNLGGSQVVCTRTQMSRPRLELSCPADYLQFDTSKAVFGLISADDHEKYSCLPSHQKKLLGPEVYNCSPHISTSQMHRLLNSNCEKKNKCTLELSQSLLVETDKTPNYFKPRGECGEGATFYIQIPCLIPA